MYIMLSADGAPRLEDADNFQAFEVRSSLPADRAAEGAAAIGRWADGHVWVSMAWLRAAGRAQDAAWCADLEAMLNYARKKGWIDETTGEVRAHVVFV